MLRRIFIFVALIFVFAACTPTPEITSTPVEEFPTEPAPTDTPSPAPVEPAVLISEVLTGMDGNNNFEFIELTNTGSAEPFDIKGWSLWLKLSEDEKETLVHRWKEYTLVPPLGHYLLARAGQDVGLAPDETFDVSLVTQRGALQLRRTDNTVADSLTWGNGPAAPNPAPAMSNNVSLERAPGGELGNFTNTGNNAADFALTDSPNPQNTGSPLTPAPSPGLSLAVDAPEAATPGSRFEYRLTVTNQSDRTASNVSVQFLIPLDLEILEMPADMVISDQAAFWGLDQISQTSQVALWTVSDLPAGESAAASIIVSAPWTYTVIRAADYSAQADGMTPVFGSPVRVAIEGGAIPIGTLKDLVGNTLVIEGTATMYTGGYYAGTGNTKFYLEDETGGVQVWVPGGEGEVNVYLGAKIRVKADLDVYRGALEMVVNDLKDVELLASPGDNPAWTPTPATIAEAANDPDLAGRLIQIEGVVARNEEFSYSYELDLADEDGNLITLYVDKQTNINVETIETGQHYRATGILEIYDTAQELYPRLQTDLERIYPPELTVEMSAPITVAPNETFRVTLTAFNYTPAPLTALTITAQIPFDGAQFVSASDDGEIRGSRVVWTIPQLAGNGTSVSVSYEIKATAADGYLAFPECTAAAAEWPDPAKGEPYFVFLGGTVPIWAIQGPGSRSPYLLSPLTTRGTVTAIFPELEGFWIQESTTDSDPLTSSGLFIQSGDLNLSIAAGDVVEVNGTVRETYQQTQLWIESPEDVAILEKGDPLPAAVELDPPADLDQALDYFESLEGMLVEVSGVGVAVGPTSQYGEFVLVLEKYGVDRLWQGDAVHNGLGIMVDDGSSAVHEDRSTLPYAVNTGDLVSGLLGPLAYTYGQFKIEPVVQPTVVNAEVELPALPFPGSNEFSIMTWNTENLFDFTDPHPSDPEMPTLQEYRVSIARVANTILAAGAPTIVGLQEVENIGILEDVAGHEYLAEYDYQPYLIEGTDSRYIDVGYLVRGDVANVVDEKQYPAPEGLTSRPPLMIQVEIQADSGPVTVFVLNNHFTSMSGGEEATEPRRNAQAAWNVTVMNEILESYPEAYLAVIGDLNSFYDALPIDTLREAGLNHVFEFDPEAGWYTYIYQGLSQTLDHILVTGNLFDLLQRVNVLHINADYAPPQPGDESPIHESDHDPVVAVFSLGK